MGAIKTCFFFFVFFFVEESPYVIEFPSENSGGLMSFLCIKTNAKHR